ncbi:MAG: T9SS type A sorting domain-containing protein [Bacteroidetes bacterium]|nr:T9SS type A sorting domain-containing protein [Bacteroidota bacterium]
MPGHHYYAGFYVNFAAFVNGPAPGWGYAAVDNIGAHFSNNEIAVPAVNNVGVEYLSFAPQVNSTPGQFFSDSANWAKVQGSFTAAGAEQWMTVGSFVQDTPIAYQLLGPPVPYDRYYCFMYYDDVCVIDMDGSAVPSASDTSVCMTALPLTLHSDAAADDYVQWNNGDTAKNIIIQDTGRYWYKKVANCQLYSDTIIVHALPTAHPVITVNGMTLSTGSYASYQWYRNGLPIPGATSQSYTAVQSGGYYVVVGAVTGCGGASDTIYVFSAGVNTYSYDQRVSMFPNPVHDILQLNCDAMDKGRITITDMTGRVLVSELFGNKTLINLHSLARGIYLYKITDRDVLIQQGKLLKD